MKLATVLLLVLTLGPAQENAPEDPFPPAQEALTIPGPGDEQWSVLDLLTEYGRVSGQSIQYTKETLGLLQNTGIYLTSGVHVPPENVHTVVEALLMHNDFTIQVLHESDPRILSVVNLNTGARNTIRQSAIIVKPEDLDFYAKHAAVLVTTSLELESLDVRTLSNSLRTMLTDANTQNIIPVGSTNSVILTGFGPQVASLARMLIYVNEQARKSAESAPQAPAKANPPQER